MKIKLKKTMIIILEKLFLQIRFRSDFFTLYFWPFHVRLDRLYKGMWRYQDREYVAKCYVFSFNFENYVLWLNFGWGINESEKYPVRIAL